MRPVACSLLLVLATSVVAQPPATPPTSATPEPDRVQGWRDDVDALVRCLKEKHPKPFFRMDATKFDQAAAELREKIPSLNDYEVAIGMLKLTAMIGDGHTALVPGGSRVAFRQYPAAVIELAEGYFIWAAAEQHKELLQARIVKIGNTKLEDAITQISSLYASENEGSRRDKARVWMLKPEALVALKLIDDPERGAFTIVDAAGKEREITLAPAQRGVRNKTIIAGNTAAMEALPSRRLQRPRYGHEWIEDKKVLYCWYDSCADLPERSVAAWSMDLLAEIDKQPPERIVFDLRRNGGGNSALLSPLELGLKMRPAFKDKGKLIALIGPGTYSSAMLNAIELRQMNNAVLIGRPTGGSPNEFGEIKLQPLPYSKWQVQHSTKYFQKTKDGANTVSPDIEVKIPAADFFAGRDPVLEAALRYEPK